MFKLFRYLKGYGRESVLGPLFKMLEATFELIVPLIMVRIIDVGIAGRDAGYVLRAGGVLVLLGLLGLAASLTAQYFAARAAMGFGCALREALLAHILSFSHAELDRTGTAVLTTRMTTDINVVQDGVNRLLRLFLRAPFITLGALVMAFIVDPGTAWIFLVATPVIGLIIFLIMAVTVPMYRKIGGALDRISRRVREAVVGVRVVRAFGRQGDECDAFTAESDALRRGQVAAGRIAALQNPLTGTVLNLAIVLILWVGAGKIDTGTLTQGQVIALVNYMTQILLALTALAVMVILLYRAAASAARINEIFAVAPSVRDDAQSLPAPLPGAPAVTFEDVSFSYAEGGERPAVSGISFTAARGTTLGIIGGTGSGKSTLALLLCRAYEPASGRILLDGRPLADYPLSALSRRVAIVPQHAALLSGTIRETLAMGRDIPDERLLAAARAAQAEGVLAAHGGLDGRVAREGANFSGGERQRLTIARALAGDPQVLILDDSASALDYATDAALRRALRELPMTVLVISQRVASLASADRILVLDDGALSAAGTEEELLAGSTVYREIYDSQTHTEGGAPHA